MDTNRHLNNVAFGRLFEEGRVDLTRRVFDVPATPGLTMILATITIEFLAEARYPGSVEVASAVTRIGGSSFTLGQAAGQDGACVALADGVMAKAVAGRAGPAYRGRTRAPGRAGVPGSRIRRPAVVNASASGVVAANGQQIAYETFGERGGRPLIMVMGLGAPMLMWHPDLCAMLAGRGFFAIRFDNRDVGRSTHLRDARPPDLAAAVTRGDVSSASYSLDDMAEDGFGLLDALGLPAAHVLGASLGGMIAQVMAARRPGRVLSLTSVMSTPAPALTNPTPAAVGVLMQPPAATKQAAIDQMLEASRVIGSPGYPADEQWRAELAGELWDQGVDPAGTARQLLAIYASGDRTEAVRGIAVPTLVVHGDSDPLINVSAGRRTAELIAGAELLIIPGMGHDLPRPVWPALVDAVSAVADRAGS
jgi:pimeloyl-ACP methyl ester carboxylesterase/acyl-CoA thioesterase FadM